MSLLSRLHNFIYTTYVFGCGVKPVRNVFPSVSYDRLEQNTACVFVTQGRQVVHVTQIGDPAVVWSVVCRDLARGEVARARHAWLSTTGSSSWHACA